MRKGNLFCISGPSGVGKGTLVQMLCEAVEDIWLSVSATTRRPREGEREGIDYFFLSDERFDDLVCNDGFLEWASVHEHRYGTPKQPVLEHIESGMQVILEIEPQGAMQVRQKLPETHLVFIAPPSVEELKRRLTGRGTEDAHQIDVRMRTAEVEMSREKEYDTVIVNDNLSDALSELVRFVDMHANQ